MRCKLVDIHLRRYSGDGAALCELPNHVGRGNGGRITAISGYPQGVVGKAIVEALVVEILPRVDDGFLPVCPLNKAREEVYAIGKLLGGPMLTFLNINHGNEVLLFGVNMRHKVEELEPHTARGAHEMVTAHLHAAAARLFEIVGVARVLIGAALGGFDVHKLEVLLARYLLPIDFPLMVGNVDAVALSHCGRGATTRGEEQHQQGNEEA